MDERDRALRHPSWIPWALTSLALVVVAVIAYNLGAQREAVAVAGEPVRRVWFYGFPGFWLFFLLFWVVIGGFRRLWWGWGYYPYRPWRYGRYYYHPYDDKHEDWEEWHRRAHNRMDAAGARGGSTPSGTDSRPIT
jgi:hypothetical protein